MLAIAIEPKTIEEAKASLAELTNAFESAFADSPFRPALAGDIAKLREFISAVESAQPTQPELEAAFHFGG